MNNFMLLVMIHEIPFYIAQLFNNTEIFLKRPF